jgi:hypothetical protein
MVKKGKVKICKKLVSYSPENGKTSYMPRWLQQVLMYTDSLSLFYVFLTVQMFMDIAPPSTLFTTCNGGLEYFYICNILIYFMNVCNVNT